MTTKNLFNFMRRGVENDYGTTPLRVGHKSDSIVSRLSVASLICVLMLTLGVGNAWGADVDSGTSQFTTVSGDLDTYISYASAQAGGTSTPVINSSNIRLYRNNSNSAALGSTLTVSASGGARITDITFTLSAIRGYSISVDGGAATTGSASSISKSSINATSVTLQNYSASQMDVRRIQVTYTVPTPCTITWHVNGGTTTTGSPTVNSTTGSKVSQLPTAPLSAACDGSKVFVGWTETAIVGTTNTKPSDLFINAAGAPTLTQTATHYYAVFADEDEEEVSKTFEFTISYSDFNQTSYAANDGSHSSTATATDASGATMTVDWSSSNVMRGTGDNSSKIQFRSTPGYLYNTTDLSSINSVSVSGGSNLTTYQNSTSNPTSNGTPKKYFRTARSSGTGYATSITVNFTKTTTVTTYSNYVTSCCTQLGTINGSISWSNATTAVVSWDNIDHVSSWTVKYKTGAGAYSTWAGAQSTAAGRRSVTITGLTPCENYDFQIIATPASGYCDKDQTINDTQTHNYTVTSSGVTNATASPAIPSTTCTGFSTTISAATGYALPAEITVTNADKTWDSGTGALTISNVTGNVTITITPTCVSPVIGTQPASNTYQEGDSPAALSVAATLGSGTLTYLWKVSTDNGVNWSNAAGTNNTASYSGASLSTGSVGTLKFKCIVGNSEGGCEVESSVASITVNAASNFPNGKTIFIQAHSSSAWSDANYDCVKAWFHSAGGSEAAQTTYWLFDASAPDAGKKLFAAIVPSTGNMPYLDIQRFTHDNCDWRNKNGGCSYSDANGSNTIRSTGNTDTYDAQDDYIRWNDNGVTMNLMSSDAWLTPVASVTDQGAGVWSGTYEYTPSGTSTEYIIATNYNGNIGNTGSNSNVTLSGMIVGSTYNVTATLDIPTHTLSMSKEFVKGTVHFDMQSHGSAIADLTNVTAGSKISAPSPAPTDAAYDFGGWYKEPACTNEWSFASDEVNETMTLYAKWTLKTYAITYLPGANGTGSVPAGVKDHGVAFTLSSSTFTRDHYTQDGWSTEDGGAKVYELGASYTTNAALTLYPHWTPANYTVTWYAGGTAAGNITTAGSPTTSVAYNTKVATLPTDPDGSGCDKVFVGWTNTTSYTHGTSLLFSDVAGSPTITGTTNFYAVFATESSGSTTLLEEDFSEITTGNSTSTTGSNTTWGRNANFSTGAQTYSAGGAVRLGTSSNTGNLTTKQLTAAIGDEITVAFKVKGWSSVEGDISVSGLYSEFTKPSDITYTAVMDGDFESKSVTVTLTKANPYIIIATTAKRAFIDDLVITKSGTTYTGHTITCASCSNEVTVAYDADPTGGTVAVTKGGNAVAENGTVKTCTGGASLVVTVTPANAHFSVSSVTFTPSAGLTAGDLSGTSTPASTTGGVYTYNVTIAENAAGTLTITPSFNEDAHIAINWNVNGSNVDMSSYAAEGLTWVYSGGDITALPDAALRPVPPGCSGTKVFAGWSEKHSDATPQNASYYDDLFTSAGPTGITSAKTYYAVYATSDANPLAGTVLWDEPFVGIEGDQPNAPTSGATVYGGATLTYNCDQTSYCKIYTTNIGAGGTTTASELLVPKSSRSEDFTVSGIPTAGQLELTLTYYSNQNLSVTTGTSGVTVGDASNDGKLYTRTITIASDLTTSFDLTFEMGSDNNGRLDDIHLVVPGSASLADYVTMCAPSYTITYNKNTSDAVTNLPSPTSVLQSTGEGVLSNTIPSRAMYTFVGWSNTSGENNTKDYDAGGAITGVSADKTVYAVWTKTPVEEIDINYTALERYVGDPAETLEVTNVVPAGADPSVTWSSDNSSVASVVAATGVVTFGAVGTATITATSTVTGTTHAVCYVTVRNKPTATFYDLIHNGNGTDLSDYNLQDVAGTSIVFPTLSNTTPGVETCDDQHYIFVGWTTSDNNDDPEDHLVTSDELENDVAKTFYAVWADGEAGFTYTQLTSNSFETSPTRYVIGVESGGTMYYFNSCANTGSNNSWGYTTNDPTNNPPIQFTLSGTASALVATSTEATARYLTPLTTKNFQMSGSSQTVQLNADGTIHNPSNDTWNLRGNSTNLRWYDSSTGTSAYFYKVEAGSAVSYRTSCCTNNVAAPSVTATSTAYTATLTWAAVDGATGYEVSWNNGAWTAASSPLVKSTLTPSTTYTYKVRATYEAPKCGALVASGSVTTDGVYTVTYAKGSGTGECTPTGTVTDASSPYEAGATVTLQANSYLLSGHTFNAWVVKDAENNDVAVSNNQFTMPASNVTVTATWTAKQDKYYDRMHQSTDASHGGVADGEGKYYLVREGCNYTVPSPSDDPTGDTDCHTTHFKLLGWIAQSHLDANGAIKTGEESYLFTGGGTKTATGATYYAIYAIMTE